jgi:hypothetical protein
MTPISRPNVRTRAPCRRTQESSSCMRAPDSCPSLKPWNSGQSSAPRRVDYVAMPAPWAYCITKDKYSGHWVIEHLLTSKTLPTWNFGLSTPPRG